MSKIRRISDFQHRFTFSSQVEQFDAFFHRFLQSDLGKIYQAIPWDRLVKDFGLKDAQKGPSCIFPPRGKLALMLLKQYSGLSDRRLIEHLNGNLEWQCFCGIYLEQERLTNYKIVSQIRVALSKKLDIEQVQRTLFSHWSDYISDKHSITMDATCYESELRYPTNVKLLWESVHWSHVQLKALCKSLGLAMPRTKYLKWKRRYSCYSKQRRKSKKERKKLTRSLLHLLNKLIGILESLVKSDHPKLPQRYYRRMGTLVKLYKQQYLLFYKSQKPKDRIVSIDKNYLRPIVRGKEVKKVEYGAKLHKFQIDGISFIEHLSFDAFHEGIRLKQTLFKAQSLTKTKTRLVGADGIYATNANRKFATRNNIRTDFKRKGRAGKDEHQRKQLARMITKERASRLEGSFGNEKENYNLKKVKARTKATETLWIFFGIHTANALEIGRRIHSSTLQKVA